jgi:hypothetical protein
VVYTYRGVVTNAVGKLFGAILGKGAEEAAVAGVEEILAKASSSVGGQTIKLLAERQPKKLQRNGLEVGPTNF